jgi:hypothetical protein
MLLLPCAWCESCFKEDSSHHELCEECKSGKVIPCIECGHKVDVDIAKDNSGKCKVCASGKKRCLSCGSVIMESTYEKYDGRCKPCSAFKGLLYGDDVDNDTD